MKTLMNNKKIIGITMGDPAYKTAGDQKGQHRTGNYCEGLC
mgnify:CR=1 FL=1